VRRVREDRYRVKLAASLVVGLSTVLSGCAAPVAVVPTNPLTSVTPSPSGTPNSVVSFANFEFVSIQGTGQIFTYNLSTGVQVLAGPPYATPCSDPSGMVVTTIASQNVMAVVCYDTGSLLTLSIHADGSLSALGSVGGLPVPYPGIVLDGTSVMVPLLGSASVNGAVAKVSIASPATPAVVAEVTLASPPSGGTSNTGYLAVSNGYVYATAGSEANPESTSSTIQVVDEATMTLVGMPLIVPHSPQQLAIQGNDLYVTLFDATELESFDISNPAGPFPLEIVPAASANQTCHPLPIAVRSSVAYIGCYTEGTVEQFNVSNPAQMQLQQSIAGIANPQRLAFSGNMLLATGASTGGQVYQLNLDEW
jgi:hypothetical protein